MTDRFISYLEEKYPRGNEQLEAQILNLKRKLDHLDDGFSDCDEDMLCKTADEVEKRHEKELERPFKCLLCPNSYNSKKTQRQHMKTHCVSYKCHSCKKSFTRKSYLDHHRKKCGIHESPMNSTFTCKHCGIPFMEYTTLFNHVVENHPLMNYIQSGGNLNQSAELQTGKGKNTVSPEKSKTKHKNEEKTANKRHRERSTTSALNDSVQSTAIIPDDTEKYDLLKFYANIKPEVLNELQNRREKLRNIKWYLNTRVEMVRDLDDGTQNKITTYFRSKTYTSLVKDDNEHNVNEAFQKMNGAMEEFIHKGSNWTINKVDKVEICTVPYSPLSGSSYMELPTRIKSAKGVINIKNDDQKCFLWSVLASLHPFQSHPERVSHYKDYENELKLTDIEYPVPLSKMEKFEKLNPTISVNVFGYEEGEIFPLYISKSTNGLHGVDLLYLSDEKQSHYCLIKNLNRFLSMTKSKTGQKRYFCRRCLHGFIRSDLLDEHYPYCKQFEFQHLKFPENGKNDILQFSDFHKQIRVPFVIYADFEALAQKIDMCLPNPQKSSSTHQTKFEPCGYAYKVVCSNDKYSKPPVVYRGPNAAEHFFDCLMQEELYIKDILCDSEPLIMNEETETQFQNATSCHICGITFNNQIIKVRDHVHIGVNGDINSPGFCNFRGAACQSCNLKLKQPKFIPVIFHNLMGFDEHALVLALSKYKDKKLSCIAKNMEKYISFSLGDFRFIDSYQFMSSSLETLISNLSKDGSDNFKQFRKAFPNEEEVKLLLRKNVYCYDYIDSHSRFKEDRLPTKEAFYNQLKNEPISDSDYEQACNVWKAFKMKTLGDFHDLYVLTDTLLLADVFEKFRDMCMDYYKLDACHFFTAPGLAWSAALKVSNVTLELLTDPLMYNFFESAMRGGVSVVTKKFARANNPYVPETYDETKPKSYLMYYDATSLYSTIMGNEKLPTGLFRWLSSEEIEKFDVMKIPTDSDVGYFLEVDLIYPESLHDPHNCYPLAPDHKLVNDEEISQYNKTLWNKLNGQNKRVKTSKLIPTLEDKPNYICHYRNLQLYLELGMKVGKIHRVLEFHQSAWLKDYIDFNIEKRKQAANEFEKDFFKLMCNSVFGKTMENLRNRVDIKIIQDEKKLKKYTSKPSFERFQIFNKDLVGVENKKTSLFLNRPIYAGTTILDLSKVIMYEFHYKVMQRKYGWENIKLLFTDTDSLCFQIFTDDVYRDMMADKHLYDLSNYPPDHMLHDVTNKKKPGTFKDECEGEPIKEFVGLRSKMYSLVFSKDNKHKNTAKGISKTIIKKNLRHAHYRRCLFRKKLKKSAMKLIRCKNHELFINHIVKTGLCSFDDKRYVKNDGYTTYAYGHYKINV